MTRKKLQIEACMGLLDNVYMPQTVAYRSVKTGLGKLSHEELSNLWAMLVTMGGKKKKGG